MECRHARTHLQRCASGGLLCAFLVLQSCGGSSPTTPSTPPTTTLFTLGGVVISVTTGLPAEGVRVVILDGPYADRSATTDANGSYSIANVQGGMTVSASRGGLAEETKSVTVTADTTLDFALQEEATGVSGRVTNILAGGGVGGVTVTVPGHDSVMTGADGRYTLDLMGDFGTLPLEFAGGGFFTRQSNVSVNSVAAADTALIPQGGAFDMDVFDHLFRSNGTRGTQRWAQNPTFEIWTRRYECRAADASDTCEEMVTTANNILNSFEAHVRNAIADAAPLTGGFIDPGPIATRAHTTDETIRESQMLVNGVISVAFVSTTFTTRSWAIWQLNGSGAIVSGHVQINAGHSNTACVFTHEVAHTLGYGHPDGQFSVPGDSVMRCDGVTDSDELHGRVLYLRPPGSLTPDTDPPGFALGASTLGSGHGFLRTFRAH